MYFRIAPILLWEKKFFLCVRMMTPF